MSLTTAQKVGMALGGVVLIGGIGFAIYYATRKTVAPVAGGQPTGGGPEPTPADTKKKLSVQQILDLIAKVNQFTAESFPLKPGMKGVNVMAMQNALKAKFGKTSVSSDGVFGFNTLKALNDLGYASYAVQSISKANFDRIIEGKYAS